MEIKEEFILSEKEKQFIENLRMLGQYEQNVMFDFLENLSKSECSQLNQKKYKL